MKIYKLILLSFLLISSTLMSAPKFTQDDAADVVISSLKPGGKYPVQYLRDSLTYYYNYYINDLGKDGGISSLSKPEIPNSDIGIKIDTFNSKDVYATITVKDTKVYVTYKKNKNEWDLYSAYMDTPNGQIKINPDFDRVVGLTYAYLKAKWTNPD